MSSGILLHLEGSWRISSLHTRVSDCIFRFNFSARAPIFLNISQKMFFCFAMDRSLFMALEAFADILSELLNFGGV